LSEGCLADGSKQLAIGPDAVDIDELYRLVDEHCKLGGAPPKLHELLAGSEVVQRKEAPAEETEPLTELEQMRANAQERSYQRMVDKVAPLTGARRVEPSVHQQGLSFATNFGTQVVVAFIGAFLLGYFFVETFVAPDNFDAKVIAGAACSFITLLLETMLLVVHEHKITMIDDYRGKNARVPRTVKAAAKAVASCKEQKSVAEIKTVAEKKTD